ncbi:MAG: colicin V production CvpA [Cellvibrionales bacterium]|jgi:membrane protein required for colicin V production|nr:colicin V production CvpA [Cellvibrionales bacterium]HCH21249.1 colicin V production CvpA [Cellvibrionales bacterium]|tara:strand:+ start:77 stop:577 length:501 start_codon:yes stop_codon:yes gene_type:complete
MNEVDWLILAILSVSGLLSLWRGFVKEAISLVFWVTAFILSIRLSVQFSTLIPTAIESESVRVMLSFIAIFFGTLIIGGLINRIISSLLKFSGMGGTDRFLGMVFGVFRGGVLVMAALIVLPPFFDVEQQAWWRSSILIPKFLLLEEWTLETVGSVSDWQQENISL